MSVYNVSGNAISTVYGIDESLLSQIYDIDENPLLPIYPQYSLTLLNSAQISTGGSPQGMATYGGYIFQFFSTINKMRIYNQSDYSLVNEIDCTVIGHGNNLQFGVVEQENDFPLLYVSDSDTATARYIYVLSIDLNQLSLVNTITLPTAVGNYPNGVIDFVSRKIYTIGYTASTVYDTSGKNIVCILDLDNPSTVLDTWQFDYLGVMNGLVWDGTHIILNANTWNGLDVKFHFINPSTKEIDNTQTYEKEYDSEYQGMSLQDGWLLVSKWIYKTISGTRTLFYEFYRLQL